MLCQTDFLNAFEKYFGYRASVLAQAPGRLEILGNHTDYNEGFVLSCAVGFGVTIAIAENGLDHCRVRNPEFAGDAESIIDLENVGSAVPGDGSIISAESLLNLEKEILKSVRLTLWCRVICRLLQV